MIAELYAINIPMPSNHPQHNSTPTGVVVAFSCIGQHALTDCHAAARMFGMRIIDISDDNDIDDMQKITYVVVADNATSAIQPLCPVFLAGICDNAALVTAEWLIESNHAGELLCPESFTVSTSLVNAVEIEHNFSLDDSLHKASRHYIRGGILHGIHVLNLQSSVCPKAFSNLLSAAGATEIKTTSELDRLVQDGQRIKSVMIITNSQATPANQRYGECHYLSTVEFLHMLLRQNNIHFPIMITLDNAAGHSPETSPLN